jgi:uncharacterized damage-inducible protein DinB
MDLVRVYPGSPPALSHQKYRGRRADYFEGLAEGVPCRNSVRWEHAVDAEYFRALFDYQYWARDKLLAAVERIPEADYFAQRPMDYGSIHGTLVHILAGDLIWHVRWHGDSPPRLLRADDVPNLEALKRRWTEHERQVRAFVDGLTDDAVHTRVVDYRNTEGVRCQRSLWQTLAHLINHATNHRSEVAAAVTQLGNSPGDLDMIAYFSQQPS